MMAAAVMLTAAVLAAAARPAIVAGARFLPAALLAVKNVHQMALLFAMDCGGQSPALSIVCGLPAALCGEPQKYTSGRI